MVIRVALLLFCLLLTALAPVVHPGTAVNAALAYSDALSSASSHARHHPVRPLRAVPHHVAPALPAPELCAAHASTYAQVVAAR